MLIINADDWGRSTEETDAALACFRAGTVTATSAMVFMKDSERAAELAKTIGLDVGLHLNLTESFSAPTVPPHLRECQEQTSRFLQRNKYAPLLYHPGLRNKFRFSYETQAEEFRRLYGRQPARVDGHLHMHHCANVALGSLIPPGTKVRRNFSFWPGEKSRLNRTYRALADKWLARKYQLTDYFFSLEACLKAQRLSRVAELAKTSMVELMTHPVYPAEYGFLTGPEGDELVRRLQVGSPTSS